MCSGWRRGLCWDIPSWAWVRGAGARSGEQECDLWRGALTDFLGMPRSSRENSADRKPVSFLHSPLHEKMRECLGGKATIILVALHGAQETWTIHSESPFYFQMALHQCNSTALGGATSLTTRTDSLGPLNNIMREHWRGRITGARGEDRLVVTSDSNKRVSGFCWDFLPGFPHQKGKGRIR